MLLLLLLLLLLTWCDDGNESMWLVICFGYWIKPVTTQWARKMKSQSWALLTCGWLEVDWWLKIDLDSWMAHATLQLSTFDGIFLGLLPQRFKVNAVQISSFIPSVDILGTRVVISYIVKPTVDHSYHHQNAKCMWQFWQTSYVNSQWHASLYALIYHNFI